MKIKHKKPQDDIQEVSNCCGADVYSDTDICQQCKEHCETIYVCPKCDGDGEPYFSSYESNGKSDFSTYECQDCGHQFGGDLEE